jgi:hypothetical protein
MPYGHSSRMNENAFLGGGSSSVSSSLPSTNVGNSRSRGAARPGTPALSAQTISTYTNSQPRASKRSNTNSSSAGAGSKSRRSVRGDPYAASGSMRLRNRKLGNRKLGRESLHNKPTVPHILSKSKKKQTHPIIRKHSKQEIQRKRAEEKVVQHQLIHGINQTHQKVKILAILVMGLRQHLPTVKQIPQTSRAPTHSRICVLTQHLQQLLVPRPKRR